MLAHEESSFQIPDADAANVIDILDALNRAARLLPEQAPLHAFVHHNTLHAFESLSFEDAVREAGTTLGTEPYAQESYFAEQVRNGRISPAVIQKVVDEQLGAKGEQSLPGGISRGDFRVQRLQNLFEVPRGELLRFCVQERGATEAFHPLVGRARRAALTKGNASEAAVLERLWRALVRVPVSVDPTEAGIRRRDQLLEYTYFDTDEVVHPVMIRLCGAFLDQGVAYWPMPGRDKGFLHAVRDLYSLPFPPPDRALAGLASVLQEHRSAELGAEDTVAWALEELQVPVEQRGAYIQETLLALRGWAGMMYRFEERPDQAPVAPLPATLLDFLAVRLVLDTVAACNGLAASGLTRFEELEAMPVEGSARTGQSFVYEAFVVAQCLPVDLEAFEALDAARAWIREVRAFDDLARRQYLQLALEERHQQEVLAGLRARVHMPRETGTRTAFQAVFCIDDREESTRRHLEEACAEVETFGYPGFFGVAMNFREAEAHKGRPLCPASMRPDHAIVERGPAPKSTGPISNIRLAYHVGRTSMVRGAIISALGVLAVVPWLLSTLFRRRLGTFEPQAPQTSIAYRRDPSKSDATHEGLPEGYTVEEMVPIVEKFLVHTGLATEGRLARLVIICGHGSTSINNPHLAAYGCGATGGGCGGFNARVFAMMANDADVRQALARRGIRIDSDCHFLGALHDTCKDAMTWYDEDRVPSGLQAALVEAKDAFATAMANNAAERCRLFGTVPLDVSPASALREVGVRARDLSEARPEYNHAKNSLCIVGPRNVTRGLFLDQRAFLVSYSEDRDPNGSVLAEVLSGSLPVSVGINLEYYFSAVDPIRYGAGSKLPHNITGLVGVMDGHASDLRTGLYEQMVELHEPVRLTAVVLAKPQRVKRALELSPPLDNLVRKRWCYLVCYDVETDTFHRLDGSTLELDGGTDESVPTVANSLAASLGNREVVPPKLIGK